MDFFLWFLFSLYFFLDFSIAWKRWIRVYSFLLYVISWANRKRTTSLLRIVTLMVLFKHFIAVDQSSSFKIPFQGNLKPLFFFSIDNNKKKYHQIYILFEWKYHHYECTILSQSIHFYYLMEFFSALWTSIVFAFW